MLPLVVRETDGCITIEHPFRAFENHFVVFPKRDVKDISAEGGPVVLECFEHIRWLVTQKNLSDYRVETNGSGLQHVTYLHFHVVSGERVR